MRRSLFAALAATVVCPFVFATRVQVEYDHKAGSYYIGQEAKFKVTVADDDGGPLKVGTVTARLDNFGGGIVTPAANFNLAESNPFTVKGTFPKAGFLRLVLSSGDVEAFPENCPDGYCESVAFQPDRAKPSVERPKDFDAFWQEALAKYDKEIPAEPEVRLDEALSDATWNVWRVSFAVPGDRRLYGFLTREKAAPERMPARMQIADKGFDAESQRPVKTPGRMTLFLTVFPWEPDPALAKAAGYAALNTAAKARCGVANYAVDGLAESREKFFFYPVILGAVRAAKWLAARDDVDPSDISYFGKGQGGGLGLAAVALSKSFRRALFFAPTLTGLLEDGGDGRLTSWPFVLDGIPEAQKDAVRTNAPYFDGVHFAKKIYCPAHIVAGYSDTLCPPHCAWVLNGALPSYDKLLEGAFHGVGHELDAKMADEAITWLDNPPETQALWPKGKIPEYRDFQSVPEMEWFAPTNRKSKVCIIVAPGGGYTGVAYRHEGLRVAENFLALGMHVVILRYRVPGYGTSPLYKSAWQDAQRCIKIVRSQAAKRGYDPERIGMTGFSAGGHLTCMSACNSLTPAYEPVDELDSLPCHLNFAAPVYPAYLLEYPEGVFGKRGEEVDCPLSSLLKFDAKTPPMCFIHGDDDGHSAVGSIRVYEQIRRMKIRGEMHIFSAVNHGFGGSVRHGFNPSGWEILVSNFAASFGLMSRTDAFKWPDEE